MYLLVLLSSSTSILNLSSSTSVMFLVSAIRFFIIQSFFVEYPYLYSVAFCSDLTLVSPSLISHRTGHLPQRRSFCALWSVQAWPPVIQELNEGEASGKKGLSFQDRHVHLILPFQSNMPGVPPSKDSFSEPLTRQPLIPDVCWRGSHRTEGTLGREVESEDFSNNVSSISRGHHTADFPSSGGF